MVKSGYRISPWDHLLEAAERLHRDYLDVIAERAPQDDPRIQAIQRDSATDAAPSADIGPDGGNAG